MSSPEDKEKHRKRIKVRSKIARSLEDRKFRQRRIDDKRKKLDLSKLSHREFCDMLQPDDLNNESE